MAAVCVAFYAMETVWNQQAGGIGNRVIEGCHEATDPEQRNMPVGRAYSDYLFR